MESLAHRDERGRFLPGNPFSIANTGGTPPIYKTAAELATKIDEYFDYILGEGEEVMEDVIIGKGKDRVVVQQTVWKWHKGREPIPPTISGLCLYLGFASRQSFYNYEGRQKRKAAEFMYVVKIARLKIEHEYEKLLYEKGHPGAIFALKNMGWHDKIEQVITPNTKPQQPNIIIQGASTAPPLAGNEEEIELPEERRRLGDGIKFTEVEEVEDDEEEE